MWLELILVLVITRCDGCQLAVLSGSAGALPNTCDHGGACEASAGQAPTTISTASSGLDLLISSCCSYE
jgi:hypothetical protein